MAAQDKNTTNKKNSKASKSSLVNKNTADDSINTATNLSEAEQLNQIRQLLFGEQVTALESALQQLSSDLSQQIALLSKKMETDLNDFQHEVESNLKEIITSQHNDYSDSQLKQQTTDESLASLNNNFIDFKKSEKLAQDKTEKALRNEIEALAKELDKKHNLAMEKLKQASDELKDNKADKNTLANMLSNMASNLQEAKD